MIPIQLTIEGLYSYQTRQTIDFNLLINAGLFGIFGSVGSGKSSILEAITFALYGETERLNAKDKRAYNMMNLKSDRAYIAFDFKNHEGKNYRATREFKRNNKRFDDIKTPTVVFYEDVNGQWIPLNHVNAQKIIGLSYDNFKRTIIIPQGKFKEFIELGAKDRTQMMKEIFNLHKYDLFDKVALLNSENLTKLNQLQGKLSGYEEVSEENIKLLEEKLAVENNIVAEVTKSFNDAQNQLQQLSLIKTDFEALQNKKIAFENLEQQKPEIDLLKEELSLYERVYKVFHQLLIDLNNTETDIFNTKNKSEKYQTELNVLQTHFSKINVDLNNLKPQHDDLPNKRLEENDLVLIAEIVQFTKDIFDLKDRTKNGQEKVNEVDAVIKNTTASIKKYEEDLKRLSENKIDGMVLLNASNWYVQQQNFESDLVKQQSKITQLTNEIAKITAVFEEQFTSVAQFEKDLKTKNETFLQHKKIIDEKCRTLEVQQQLSHFAHNLADGEACPLCGATEHPSVLELKDVTENLQELKNAEEQLQNQHNAWLLNADTTKQQLHKLNLLKEQLHHEELVLSAIKNQMVNHKNLFVWDYFNADDFTDFEQKKKATALIENQIKQNNEHIQKQRLFLDTQRENLDKYKQALEQFQIAEIQKSTQVNQNKNNLKQLAFSDFESLSIADIHLKLNALQAQNRSVESNFKTLTETYHKVSNQLSSQQTLVKSTEEQLNELQKKLTGLNEIFDKKIAEHSVSSKEKVIEILHSALNTEALQKKINDFTIAFETIKNQLTDLEAKLQNVVFNEHEFHQLKLKQEELKMQVTVAIENATSTKTEATRLAKAFQEKRALVKQLNEVQKRNDNLKTMLNMFKGSGFVQYVSTIYLQQLCENANVRFRKMTRNQLSLHLNDANDFEVIDYLNEGKSRSVKTLSGGQMFQVSLSLALALAESVQTNAKADKNFFFIDEGFGTQDAESVNIVFETLNQLYKENRIVGIISHVEELKDRIPVALNITKDEEKGSFIEQVQ